MNTKEDDDELVEEEEDADVTPALKRLNIYSAAWYQYRYYPKSCC